MIDDGGPATGMTLRDWFAGQALMGLLAARAANDDTMHEEVVDEANDYAAMMIEWLRAEKMIKSK